MGVPVAVHTQYSDGCTRWDEYTIYCRAVKRD